VQFPLQSADDRPETFPYVPGGQSEKFADCAGQYAPGGQGLGAALPRGQYPPAVQLAGIEYPVAQKKAGGHSPHVTRCTLLPVFCEST
jgi:hypothetical protein